MKTVFVAGDRAELALAESALREVSIPFITHNAVLEALFAGGEAAGFGPAEIRVDEADYGRANEVLRGALGATHPAVQPAELEPEEVSPGEVEARATAIRYARLSAVWSLWTFWGIGSLLGIYYGARSLRASRDLPTSQRGLAFFGIGLGVLTLLVATVFWAAALARPVP